MYLKPCILHKITLKTLWQKCNELILGSYFVVCILFLMPVCMDFCNVVFVMQQILYRSVLTIVSHCKNETETKIMIMFIIHPTWASYNTQHHTVVIASCKTYKKTKKAQFKLYQEESKCLSMIESLIKVISWSSWNQLRNSDIVTVTGHFS